MVFSSFTFLFVFLPLFLAVYYLCPYRWILPYWARNLVALVGSLIFYSWGAPLVVHVLIVTGVVDYLTSRSFQRPDGSKRKWLFGAAVGMNLLALGYYKYSNFFVAEVSRFSTLIGYEDLPWVEIALPAGISFFTFQKISYLADVYSGRTEPAKRLTDYLCYVSLFPQLIAGPIVRYHDINEQLIRREHTLTRFTSGIWRFSLGLGRKVLIADELGAVADNIFALPAEDLTMPWAWLGILCYTFQIYHDFAGYSDMAIGLGRMMGFEFLENFNLPYLSRSITEFWRRWHISLSNWMKEYLYIPLGGNRKGRLRTYLNLWIVFLLSGLWHGASWNFVVWGAFHGSWLAVERMGLASLLAKLPSGLQIFWTFFLVVLSWVLFRSVDLESAIRFYGVMFGGEVSTALPRNYPAQIIHQRAWAVFLIAWALLLLPLWRSGAAVVVERWKEAPAMLQLSLQMTASLVLFLLSVLNLSLVAFTPFLYFQF